MSGDIKKPITIFFSYAHEDELLQQELAKQLRLFERQGLISAWHDRDIQAGQEWAHAIDTSLNAADIILLLVSPDFIVSDYYYSIEMKRAMERHEAKKARVIPIILRPINWKSAPFGKLQALPRNGKPVTSWPDRDEAFLDIATGIEKILKELSFEQTLRLGPNDASRAVNTAVPGTQAPTVSAMGSQAAGSNVDLPGVVAPVSQVAQPTELVTARGQTTPATELAFPSKPSATPPEMLIPAQPLQRGISRRTVILGLAGLAVVTVAGGSIALLTHTPPSTHTQPQSSTPTVAAANLAISSSGAMFGYDLAHTHFNPNEHILSPTNVSRLVPLWGAATGGPIGSSSPAVANGVVYVGSVDHKLYAFEAGTGKPLWSAATGDAIFSSPAVANGVVYVGSYDHKLYALEVGAGKRLWSAATGGAIGSSSPAVTNGVVYVGSQDSKLYAFEVGTGKSLWSAPTGAAISSSPAVANGVVYVGSDKLYALEAGTGKPLWSAATGAAIFSSPAVANGVVYVGSFDKKLYALEAGTGKPLWSALTGGYISSSPAVANGVVYVGSKDTKLYAFEAGTGKVLWSAPTGDVIFSSPAVANGVVYVGSNDKKLYAFEAGTGKPLWSAATGAAIFSSPAVANGVVYVGSVDHKLYAFHLP